MTDLSPTNEKKEKNTSVITTCTRIILYGAILLLFPLLIVVTGLAIYHTLQALKDIPALFYITSGALLVGVLKLVQSVISELERKKD